MVDLMVSEPQSGTAGKGVPAGFKMTEVGVIPLDWEIKTIGQLNPFITSGSRGWADFYVDYGDLFVRITNMSRNSIYLDTKTSENKFVSLPATSTEGKRTQLNNGDVLISITADIGIIGYIDESIAKPAYINQHISLVRFDDNSIDNKFVAYFLASENVQKKFLANSDVGAKAGMNLNGVRSIIFAVPTIQEQSAIAEALTDVDTLIVELKKVLAKKQAIKTATMQQLLTGKTRLPQFALRADGTVKGYKKSELGEIPEDWTITLLNDVIDSCSSGATPYRGISEYYKGNNRWITSGELNYCVINDTIEKISDSAIKDTNLKIHPAGTFLMAITGLEAAGTRGACGIVGKPSATNQSCMAIYPNNKLDSNYLYHWYVYNGDTLAFKYCQGTKQLSYTAGLIRKIPLFLPTDKKEQTAITAILSDMDKDIQTLQQRLDKTRQLKQGMMQELLTGKTRLI